MTTKFLIPFATDGDKSEIPAAIQTDGSISLPEGWGFDYSRNPSADPLAKRIDRAAMNWLFYAITQAVGQIQQTGAPDWITAADNGGTAFPYEQGAIVRHGGITYGSLAGTNTTEPGTDPTKWAVLDLSLLAPLASPAFTGTPTAPTAAPGNSTTQLATTAFVAAALATLSAQKPFVGGTATIAGAERTFIASDLGKVVRRANGGAAMTDTLPGTGTAVMAAGWWVEIVNSDPLALLTVAAGGGATLDNGTPLVLGPGQSVVINSDGVSYWAARGTGRIQLRADLTLYVSTTGNDATNTGLTAASPFLTIQRAWNLLAAQYDLNGYTATIQLADGTYTAPLSARGKIVGSTGAPSVVIQGNTGNINAVIISTTGTTCLSADGAEFTVKYLKLQTTTSGSAIIIRNLGVVSYGWINFGAVAGSHIAVTSAGSITCVGDYTISGGAGSHWAASNLGSVMCSGFTITLTGTPAFSYTFASCYDLGSIYAAPLTFAGAASGTRYIVTLNAVIYVNGSGASYFPGSVAGTTTTGGQYG